MTAFRVRRIVDKAEFGVIESNHIGLFDMVDEFTDPYAFEFTSTRFSTRTNNWGHGIMWQRFVYPSRMLEHFHT
jgi:hypothetical protein